jgi:hypothetical protein
MNIRLFGALLCGAALLTFVPASSASAQGVVAQMPRGGVAIGNPDTARGQSGNSNTSDRMGGGGGKGSARATTVKSSKSNTSDRMGGGGGGKGAVQLNPQPEPPGKKKSK